MPTLAPASKGTDAIGLLVGQQHASTSTFITDKQAADIVRKMRPCLSTVLVTHLSWPDEIAALARRNGASTVQQHGDTTQEEALEIRRALPHVKTYKVIHVTDASCIAKAHSCCGVTDGLVLDTSIPSTGQVGGTGMTHDWSLSARIVREDLPVILAGGLKPSNVADAVRRVRPYAVDVNSGVSNRNGSRAAGDVYQFVRNAKNA